MKVLQFAGKYLSGKPYNLEVVGSCSRYEGYRYLAESMNLTPSTSYMDGQFSWIYSSFKKETPQFDLIIFDKMITRIHRFCVPGEIGR